jgi:glutamate carboxypeptidase
MTGGASDASYTTGYGVPSLDGLGPVGGRDHSPDEYLILNSVAPRAALLAGLIASIGGKRD